MSERLLDHVGGYAFGHQFGGVGLAETVRVVDPHWVCHSARLPTPSHAPLLGTAATLGESVVAW